MIAARTDSGTGGTAVADDATTNVTTLYYTVTFDEGVNGFAGADITLGGTAKGELAESALAVTDFAASGTANTRSGPSRSTPRAATAR